MNNGTTGDRSVQRQCGECLRDPRAFDATIVAADYAAPVDHLVLALKFGNRLALAPLFAGLLQQAMQRAQPTSMPDLLTVVPLGEQRLIERGFNQALEIARPLSRAINIPLAPQLLVRTRNTLMQARLQPAERHRNIHRAFVLSPGAIDRIKGLHIAVTDDVIIS